MARVASAISDAGFVALLGYGGFRFAAAAAPCNGNMASCPVLAPFILVSIALVVVAYFALGFMLWGSTPAQRLFRVPVITDPGDEIV
jgi:hypothetical protein